MPKSVTLAIPDEFETGLKSEMRAAALEAFKQVAGKHAFSEYMNRTRLADYLGCSTATVDKLTALGLPTITVDSLKMYKKSEVDTWLLKHQY
ncbi:DNA-binding protein [Lacticaseibacillus sp. 866-1]|uniref:DNA-binding protein n=1 Tax=Lacticaseibacillus sp. 866-1 TaxID=2799576 RepID=UPI0019423BF7|nr:DNA-binding protein [Lacticaseibacillus sp. 866-1]